ncbi:hypothetical protein AURDEDRAFT_170862 [Auricularia subglabra TFB-10046 SS5]|nr:hypothetical protein AURDEDRAFT_170862 [Auricularia subglabra TFB-10046 SS5]
MPVVPESTPENGAALTLSDGSTPSPHFLLPTTLALAPAATTSPSASGAAPLAPKLKTIFLTVIPILAVLLAFGVACEIIYLRRRSRVKKARHASFSCRDAVTKPERGSVSSERTFVGAGDPCDFKSAGDHVRIVSPAADARPFSSYTFESRASAWFGPFENSFDVDADDEKTDTARHDDGWVSHKSAQVEVDIADHGKM